MADIDKQEIQEYIEGLGYSVIAYRKRVGECQRTLIDLDSNLKKARKNLEIAERFYKSEIQRLGLEE